MKKSSKLIFFGNERLVSGLNSTDAPILTGLIERGYDIAAVVSHHSEGTSRQTRRLEVAEIASAHGIPLFLPHKPVDIEAELQAFQADAAILAAYGRIIPQRIIDLFSPLGIINVHPSLLPRHRGPTPIETTILEGDTEAGVSIMQLTAGMDEGPVYGQVRVTLSGHETKFELYDLLAKQGSQLLFDLLPTILDSSLIAVPQENNDVTYTSLITKELGNIDPTTDTAEVIERKVRAYLNFPKTRLHVPTGDVIITSAKVTNKNDEGALVITCAENTWLEVTELIAPSGKRMSGQAYLRGYRT